LPARLSLANLYRVHVQPAGPHVDVCVLTWNTRDLSLPLLQKLLDSDQGVPFRVLVRDNGSTDGTAEAIARDLPAVDLEAGVDNLGFAAGMNRLFARSRAPYVFCLNSDACPEPGTLRTLVSVAQRLAGLAAVAPRLVRPDGSLEHSTWPFPSLALSALFASGARELLPLRAVDRLMLDPGWRHDRPRWVGWAVGAALLIPRSTLDRVGGFDESFFMYGEDADWCWRARERGLGIWFEPSASVCHVGSVSAERRYRGEVTARKVAATIRLIRGHRGPAAAAAFRGLELATAARLWARARRQGDASMQQHWAVTARALARLSPLEPPATSR